MGMIDVGDILPGLGITTTSNASGALADPTTVTLTLTLPDGSALVGHYPSQGGDTLTIARAGTGTYACTHVTTLPGHYVARWVAVGGGADGAYGDVWNVTPSSLLPLIGLADIREQTRANATTDDETLRWYGLVASRMAEDHTQLWRRQALVGTFDGGRQFLQLQRPVISVTTIVEDGSTLTGGAGVAYTLNGPTGKLYRGSSRLPSAWSCGVQNVVVTYVGGPADGMVDEPVLQGVRLQVQHLWDSQRGGTGIPRQSGADFTTDPRTGYSIPNRVLELWRSAIPMGGYYVA